MKNLYRNIIKPVIKPLAVGITLVTIGLGTYHLVRWNGEEVESAENYSAGKVSAPLTNNQADYIAKLGLMQEEDVKDIVEKLREIKEEGIPRLNLIAKDIRENMAGLKGQIRETRKDWGDGFAEVRKDINYLRGFVNGASLCTGNNKFNRLD